MNNAFSARYLWVLVPLLSLATTACKKKSDGDPAKTLNKASLTNNKEWYNQGGTIIHVFKSNGIYSNTGSWSWKNNSDTLELKATPSSYPTYWKIYWNTDSEMSCERVGTDQQELYKTQLW